MMFTRLKALRDQLASVPSALCDPEARRAIVKAIDELDDAMVLDVRAQHVTRERAAERETVNAAYAGELLARFGAPAEVLVS